jgi:hypothetical protein
MGRWIPTAFKHSQPFGASLSKLKGFKMNSPHTYKIICWHNSATEGTHQRVLFSARTMGRVLREFERYLSLADHLRSFNKHNLIQLHHIDNGVIASFPASLR